MEQVTHQLKSPTLCRGCVHRHSARWTITGKDKLGRDKGFHTYVCRRPTSKSCYIRKDWFGLLFIDNSQHHCPWCEKPMWTGTEYNQTYRPFDACSLCQSEGPGALKKPSRGKRKPNLDIYDDTYEG